jgi:formylglycine-generating enzyme
MRGIPNFIPIAAVLCFFWGCQSAPDKQASEKTQVITSPDAVSSVEVSAPRLDCPAWVLSPPREEGYLYGVGGGRDMATAKRKALVNTGQQFSITVKTACYEQSVLQDDQMDRVCRSIDEQLTDHLLKGVKFFDEYRDEQGFCWVMTRAPLECSLDVAEGFLLSYFLEIMQEPKIANAVMNRVEVSYRKRFSRNISYLSKDMVYVKGGSFDAGSNVGQPNEAPRHKVTLNDFLISSHETTQAEWLEVMESLPADLDYGSGDFHPIYNISWLDAVEYCNKRSVLEGFSPSYFKDNGVILCDFRADGYRLPTEAEWEFAAKGGSYMGIYSFRDHGWHQGNSNGLAQEIGTLDGNPLGIFDMDGNVWEWCWDWYGTYRENAADNPGGPERGIMRAIRGGAWNSPLEDLTYFSRGRVYPDEAKCSVGFRVVRSMR